MIPNGASDHVLIKLMEPVNSDKIICMLTGKITVITMTEMLAWGRVFMARLHGFQKLVNLCYDYS